MPSREDLARVASGREQRRVAVEVAEREARAARARLKEARAELARFNSLHGPRYAVVSSARLRGGSWSPRDIFRQLDRELLRGGGK